MVPRQPMARAESLIAWTGLDRSKEKERRLYEMKTLNIDTLHYLLEVADVVTEGRIDPHRATERFFGSTVITIDLARAEITDEVNAGLAARLLKSLGADLRSKRAIETRVHREIARLLGARTSNDFEAQTAFRSTGTVISITADFESALVDERAMAL